MIVELVVVGVVVGGGVTVGVGTVAGAGGVSVGKAVPVMTSFLVIGSNVAAVTSPAASTYVKSQVILWQTAGSPSTLTRTCGFSSYVFKNSKGTGA